jgi:hypothetical protein
MEALVVLRTAHNKPAGVWCSVVGICDKLGAQFRLDPE